MIRSHEVGTLGDLPPCGRLTIAIRPMVTHAVKRTRRHCGRQRILVDVETVRCDARLR